MIQVVVFRRSAITLDGFRLRVAVGVIKVSVGCVRTSSVRPRACLVARTKIEAKRPARPVKNVFNRRTSIYMPVSQTALVHFVSRANSNKKSEKGGGASTIITAAKKF